MSRIHLAIMAATLIPFTAAVAQTPPSGYDEPGAPPGYGDQGPPPGYAGGPPPPPGYNGSQPPPPPPGYEPDAGDARQQAQDQRYAYEAEQWAHDNCVEAHGDVGAGAAIGGVLGAIIGSGLAGPHDRGAGFVVGGALGALGGAAVAANSASGATSPGCPPGYVLRGEAPAFYYGWGTYLYGAPPWYHPWYFDEGHWFYRPYPYHSWYYRHYYRPGDGWHGGYGRQPGWRGGHWGHPRWRGGHPGHPRWHR